MGSGNIKALHKVATSYRDARFVDLGVRFGYSSEILVAAGKKNGCWTHGFDVDGSRVPRSLISEPSYHLTISDSVTAGLTWNPRIPVSLLFVDTIHTREMVLAELWAWFPHLAEDATVVFHDTNWEPGAHETFGGKIWGRPEQAVIDFFGLRDLRDFESNTLRVRHYPDSFGMTFVTVKNPQTFKNSVTDWQTIFQAREEVLSFHLSQQESDWLGIHFPEVIDQK